jgi:hypothetical protein
MTIQQKRLMGKGFKLFFGELGGTVGKRKVRFAT